MRYDTAGNKIYEPVANCDCSLTGGCKKCMCSEFVQKLQSRVYRVIWYRGNCDADEIVGYYNDLTKAEVARKEFMMAHSIIYGKPCCSKAPPTKV